MKLTIPGFRFSGISAGIKKTGKKDIALICSDVPAITAGVFTINKIKAAPVKLDMQRIALGKGQAIIINSGNANACTGSQGLKDAQEMAELTAKELGISSKLVYVASTGIIGKPLPMQKLRIAIPKAVKRLSYLSIKEAASAILTTDTFPKIAFKKITLMGQTGTIAGIAKGAGMICPSMATMLCFIVTDIAVEQRALDSALRTVVKKSFNRLTIDNDMSTNDTVLVMTNGLLKNKPITKKTPFYKSFESALYDVTSNLSRMIAIDGEGATKLIEILVKGAKTESDAEMVAKAIANSFLVKTAIYGEDPNWGRLMAAIGYSGAEIKEDKINITINNCKVVKNGAGINKIPPRLLSRKEVLIIVDIGVGRKEAKVLTCDLTEDYVKINAHYRT